MNLKKTIAIVSLLLLSILQTACGTRYPQSQATPAQSPRAVTSLPSDIGRFLSEGQDFQRQLVSFSAWGEDLELELQQAYFAASGRYCRPFTLYGQESKTETRLACKNQRGQWEEVRLITQGSSRGAQ